MNNMMIELNKMGNFENLPAEEMFEWVMAKLPQEKTVFAGSMPTMANVKHITGRQIVNHPHYENQEVRDRTFKVYTIWSRRPLSTVSKTLKDLGVTHFVYEKHWCYPRGKPGCFMPEIFDLYDEEYRGEKPTCEVIRDDASLRKKYFKTVFKNSQYEIFKLL